MKFKGRGYVSSILTRSLLAVFMAFILIGAVFVGMVSGPLDPPHSDYGLDTDSDGDFNFLVVEVVVTVPTAGDYIIDAVLEDSILNWIDSTTNFTYLEAGTQIVQLRFIGWLIRTNGQNGPYTVYIDLYDDSYTLLDSDIHLTDFYNFAAFEFPPANFISGHTDYGLDTDSDGYFNYLVVNVTVNVDEIGIFEVRGALSDGTPPDIDSDSNQTFLSSGSQIVQLYFNGMDICRNAENGPYTVTLNLYDGSLNWMDLTTYSTNAYTYSQFQSPGVLFEPPHSDYCEDTDSDGLFNYLVVNVTVNVIVTGSYEIEGSLSDSTPSWIDNDSNSTFLNSGIQVVQIRFSGVSIYNNAENGFFTAELDVFDDLAIWLDSDVYITNSYTFDQFQPPPAIFHTPHSDYGLDTDSDGFFNYLVVNISVDVSSAGDYKVEGPIFDSLFILLETVNNLTFLNTGIQVAQLYFDGTIIYNNGQSGSFIIFLELFDIVSNSLDTDMYMTGSYTYDQFQPPPPPEPPTDLQAQLSGGGTNVMLSWTASADDGSGENDVAGYTVYKSSMGVNGIYNYEAWIIADGSPSYSWTDSAAGDGDPNDYFYIVRVKDTLDLEEQNTEKVGKVVYDLVQGWNLFSIPLEQVDTSRAIVLQTLGTNVVSLQGYHAGKSTPWLNWHRDKPNPFNDIIDINHKEGYYIDMENPDSLTVAGKVPSSTQISLKSGWNLVGYPSLETNIRDTALISILGSFNKVEYFNSATDTHNPLGPSDPMNPGLGYWIHATEDCNLII